MSAPSNLSPSSSNGGTSVTSNESEVQLTREQIKAFKEADARSDRRLALLVFLATLAGNLLAFTASLADASGLIVPLVNMASPMPAVTIAGSATILGSELGLASNWVKAFQESNAEIWELPIAGEIERKIRFNVNPVGTLGGVELATGGSVNLLAASEALSDEQITRLASSGVALTCAAPIGYDAIVFVTDITNRLTRPLTSAELAGILGGTIRSWSEVGGTPEPIRIFAREGSGTTDLVLQEFLGHSGMPSHVIGCQSQADCLNLTLSTRGSLYWVSLSWLRLQPDSYLVPVLIENREGLTTDPLSPQFDVWNYPVELIRPLYMYVLESPRMGPGSVEASKQFLSFVRGVQGQQLLEIHFFNTHFKAPPGVEVHLPVGFGPAPNGLPIVCR
ncbi:MAG: substrate-binding domain-containing protein [Chloroflexaceae bacterium]